MENVKKLKNIIIGIIIVIIVIIILILILLNKSNKSKSIEQESNNEESPEIILEQNNNGFTKMDDYSMFYTVLNTFNKYMDVLTYKINEEDTVDENPYWIKSDADKKEILFSMLDNTYKKENNINSSNDIKIEDYNETYSIIPIEIKVKDSSPVSIYALHIYVENTTKKTLEEKFFVLKMNGTNSTFSVIPIENCDNIDEIKINETENEIKENDYNKFYIETMTDESIAKAYIQRYKYMIINYTELFYNKYMEQEYKEKRFGNINEFKKYVEENKNEILNEKAVKYIKNNYNDYNEFVIVDQNNNTCIFKEYSPMNFTLKFDNYVIATEKFKETYNDATDEEKVQMDIDKFFQMINRHDYKNSYNCISENFKNNYFSTEEKFKEYAKQNFFEYNKLEFKNCEKKGANLYVVKLELNDITGENNEAKEINIIIKLNEELNFEIAFNV